MDNEGEFCKVCGKSGHRNGECLEKAGEAEPPEGFDDKVENLEFMKKRRPIEYRSTIDEIKAMARGGNGEGIRGSYYEGWTDGHFKKLLEAVGEQVPAVESVVNAPGSSEDLEAIALAERFVDHLEDIDRQIEEIGSWVKKIFEKKMVNLGAVTAEEKKKFDELIQHFQVGDKKIDLTNLFDAEGYQGVMHALRDARNNSVREQGHGEKILKRFDVRG
jgi:hypothetical protein